MSKLNKDKINFNDDNFLVDFNNVSLPADKTEKNSRINKEISNEGSENEFETEDASIYDEVNLHLNNAKKEAKEIIEKAQKTADEIIEKAKEEAQELINKSSLEANKIEEDSKVEAQKLLEDSKEELEQIRIKTTNDAYQDGYKDGESKLQEELEEKIKSFDDFCSLTSQIKSKVLKSSSNEILTIISEISKKILLTEINGEILDKIIKKTISLLEKKEDINIIVSTKYAQMLFELQNKTLSKEEELKFEDFKQYQNFNIVYNPKFAQDTIIIESLTERFDASISSQLDIIIRDIYEKTQNDEIEIEEYNQNETD